MGSTSSRGESSAYDLEGLRSLAAWLVEQQVEEVVMESTAQYWKPVWGMLERYWKPICRGLEDALVYVGLPPSGAGAVEPRAGGTEEGFPLMPNVW